MGSQRHLTDLYVISRFAQYSPRKHVPEDEGVHLHLGVASNVVPSVPPRPVNDLKRVSERRDHVWVYVLMDGLVRGDRYEYAYQVRDPNGKILFEDADTFEAQSDQWVVTGKLEFGYFDDPGIWVIDAQVGGSRARGTFEVQR